MCEAGGYKRWLLFMLLIGLCTVSRVICLFDPADFFAFG